MKTTTSRVLKFYKCLVFFYLIWNCILGAAIVLFASYLLLFRKEGIVLKPRSVVLYFLILPLVLTPLNTLLGWISLKRKNVYLMKLFAVGIAITATLEISGCLWCFGSFSKINDDVLQYSKEKFAALEYDTASENWWNGLQSKLQCCGLHGPTDYKVMQSLPFSCCGSDPNDHTRGSCTFMWQKGCSSAMTNDVSHNLVLLSLLALCVAFLQIPGIFISWCFANRIQKGNNKIMT